MSERRAMVVGVVLGLGMAGAAGTMLAMAQPAGQPEQQPQPAGAPRGAGPITGPYHVTQSPGGRGVYLWRIDRREGKIEYVGSSTVDGVSMEERRDRVGD